MEATIGTEGGGRPRTAAGTTRTAHTEIDLDALAGAARGEPAALGRVFAAIHPTVLAYCRARLGRSAGAVDSPEDVAQTVCLNLLRALPRHQNGERPFMAYVYVCAANAVTDVRRRLGRRRTEYLTELHDVADRAPGPEERGLHTDTARRTRELLDGLPERMREVVVLRIALGLSVREAAEALGMTEQTVRVTQHRALRKLRTAAA
jgi:RNA polymerase sigma-70 factor (ECF subfamily)